MKRELIRDSAQIIAGNFLVALGVNAFILPNDVLTGGLAGVAVALQPLVAIEPTLFINAATIVLFGIGAVILGRQFALKTLLSTICYPLFISLLSWGLAEWFTPETFIMDQYLAAIYGGVFMGCGVGLVFRCGASTGGMDIPPTSVESLTPYYTCRTHLSRGSSAARCMPLFLWSNVAGPPGLRRGKPRRKLRQQPSESLPEVGCNPAHPSNFQRHSHYFLQR